jgi:PIN domain nuclease of toxin-antitoxin system
LIADACALIVFQGYGGQTLSSAGKAAIGAGDVFVSPITVWEISRKMTLGKLERPAPPGFAGSLSEWLRLAGYRILPMTRDACERANALPIHHKDPMDPMLIAAALDRGTTVITDDDVFAQYGVATPWPMPVYHASVIPRTCG